MTDLDLKFYLNKFATLRIDKTKQKTLGGDAPHKPILLLSVIELIEKGIIKNNEIHLTDTLQQTFNNNWQLLVNTKHECQLVHPFFHLKNEGFWFLIAKAGYQTELNTLDSISSFNKLTTVVAYAKLEENLFNFLLHPFARQELKQCLLQHYFQK